MILQIAAGIVLGGLALMILVWLIVGFLGGYE
jgi:hypothetical protein